MASANAKSLLKGFEFNSSALLSSTLFKPYSIVTTTGVITITGVIPINDVVFPSGATHVSFTGAYANMNYATNVVDFKLTNVQNVAINGTAST
ncbi:hypothetical protein, partial [Salmonella sp. s60093]|uniref:hypothetical protein n=1 Tax=Salmonella sp. s60093 TaxID=3159721 RepID=UPI00397F7DF5